MGGGGLPWNSECTGGLLGLEFRMHEGVSSPGIPKGGGGLLFDGQKQHCKSETAFSWVSSYSSLVIVLQDGGQQPRCESLISCLKVMFL